MHIKDHTYQSLWASTSKKLHAAAVLILIHVGLCRSQQKTFYVYAQYELIDGLTGPNLSIQKEKITQFEHF